MSYSILEETQIESALEGQSVLKPKGGSFKRNLASTLMLTSLVDAFSILVVYLLMSYSSSSEILYIGKDMVLPSAKMTEDMDQQTIIKYEKGEYFVGQDLVAEKDLVAKLLDLRTKFKESYPELEFPGKIIIQADKGAKYLALNSVILAGSHAGYEEIKFAVLSQR